MSTPLAIEESEVPGLLVVRLPLHEDSRGWFEEVWQREKMTALGLPDFGPVQANLSHNHERGSTRGLHAEPWDKLVTVAAGRAFGAWVDLRGGPSFGASHTLELAPGTAVFVPRGVANSYQTLTDDVAYAYLVNDHWRPDVTYTALALDDPDVAIAWPIPLSESEVSPKDRTNPRLADLDPLPRRGTLVLGAAGQLGRALVEQLPGATALSRADLDLASTEALEQVDWRAHDVVVNAAAFTRVDAAEQPAQRRECWRVNARLPATLARLSRTYGFRLVHYSTDYAYDGDEHEHDEDETPTPLSVYGQSKVAGDLAVLALADSLVLRTSWVTGDGAGFVATMADLARRGVSPSVVDDQWGRLTFTSELAAATLHLLAGGHRGLFHVTNGGAACTWFDVAQRVFAAHGRSPDDVRPVSTADYTAGRPSAPRPVHSTLRLTRLEQTGWSPTPQLEALEAWLGQPGQDGSHGR